MNYPRNNANGWWMRFSAWAAPQCKSIWRSLSEIYMQIVFQHANRLAARMVAQTAEPTLDETAAVVQAKLEAHEVTCDFCGAEPSPLNNVVASNRKDAYVCSVCIAHLSLHIEQIDAIHNLATASRYHH